MFGSATLRAVTSLATTNTAVAIAARATIVERSSGVDPATVGATLDEVSLSRDPPEAQTPV
jgi:hypothetical protein